MAGFTTLDNIPLSVKAEIDATVLLDPEDNFLYSMASMQKKKRKGTGDTYRWPKYGDSEAFTTPLRESELDTDPQVLSKTFIDAQVDYYGTHYLISERSVDWNPEDVLRTAAGQLNRALRKTEDILARNILLTTTTNITCLSGENGDRPTDISEKDLSTVVATLTTNLAKPISKQIGASNKFGTAPVPVAYLGIFHPDLVPDFEALPNFKTIDMYGSTFTPFEGEWGSYSRIRLAQTTMAPKEAGISALGNTRYSNMIMGAGASALLKQDGTIATIVGPKKVGALETNYTYGIKTTFAGALLFDQHVANLTCTRSSELD